MMSDYKPLPLPHRRDLSDTQALAESTTFLDLMRQRHSVRDYSTRPVPEQVIANCIATAGTAPSGANQQPWHFAAISSAAMKAQIREAAEIEEERFYEGGGGDEWLAALEPIGTGAHKPHLTDAPWLIVIFAQRWGVAPDGTRRKHYYVPESVGIATGMLITALHNAGLVCLTHTPNPMKFLNGLCARPDNEKPVMILAVGHAAEHASVPAAAKQKKHLDEIITIHRDENEKRNKTMETVSENACFGGVQGVYSHASKACACDMTFGLFLPEEARDGPVPVLWYLSGLTCTHENAMTKAGAQSWAAEQGIALVFPDTSPRGDGVANDDAYDLGQGAGFYVNATQDPWKPHFQMWDYVAEELPNLITENFAVDADRQAITGHSMGGHGALTLAMGLKGRYRSVSAFSPIVNPTAGDWGRKQFAAYLGADESKWTAHDATLLMRENGFDGPILTDTGTKDQFVDLLMPESFAEACAAQRQHATLRMQPGYDHSYFFVSTFMEDHVAFHAEALYA